MDRTDELALACGLSRWKGDLSRCRRCDRELSGYSRKWCGKYCVRLWARNHSYRKARRAARQRSRIKCGCPKVRSHISCVRCGLCEGKAKQMGIAFHVNHIIPLVGDRTAYSQYSCSNHQDNLESVCVPCHREITAEQQLERFRAKRTLDRRQSRDRQ